MVATFFLPLGVLVAVLQEAAGEDPWGRQLGFYFSFWSSRLSDSRSGSQESIRFISSNMKNRLTTVTRLRSLAGTLETERIAAPPDSTLQIHADSIEAKSVSTTAIDAKALASDKANVESLDAASMR
jgi:hypothetical protein